ncbi:hypothetical protein BD779DRAFT_560798 [Infundibulicybe gibba]|nr:hypothetical protein BD779DRAFT_560798 [Infundibulicybe gibba]
MSFASSLNAFGMKPATTSAINTNLSVNTGAAGSSTSPFGGPKPAGSLFGQQQPQQQQQQGSTGFGGGAFGQPQQQQQQQPQQGGGLFGQGNTQQPPQQQQSGGFFGQNNTQQGQQQQGQPQGGLFGQQPQQQQQQQPAGGGLFGGQNTQQQGTGGLFGGQQQQQPAAGGGGLFGGQQQQQPAGGGGLFGGQNTQQPQQQQQQQQQNAFGGNSLFGGTNTAGNNTTTNNPNPFGGFGGGGNNANNQQQQQQPQQQTGLWGAPNPVQAQSTIPAGGFGGGFGVGAGAAPGGLFGSKSTQPQQQQQLGMSSNQPAKPPPFTKSTKFNDLPDDVKRVFEGIDAQIQGRVQISKELHQRKLGDAATQGQELIRSVHKDLVNVTNTTRADLHTTNDLRTRVDQAAEDTIVATRLVDGFKNPQGGAGYLKDHAGFPLEYFTRVAEQMKDRLAWYKSTIEQIERKLASSTTHARTPQGISSTLQAQHATFIALANKTAAADAELQKIKTLYTQLWRAKTGSVRDPFNELDRNGELGEGDFGLARLNVR